MPNGATKGVKFRVEKSDFLPNLKKKSEKWVKPGTYGIYWKKVVLVEKNGFSLDKTDDPYLSILGGGR